MTYRIVPRPEIGLPVEVRSSDGTLRPSLTGARYMTAHYTGVDVAYAERDVATEVRRIQMVFGATKPFEYNYVVGAREDDRIYEFAGKQMAAHSAGENGDAFGVLFLLGVNEELTDTMIDKWRWLRDVLIYDGVLRPDVDQRQHFQMPDAATACAGRSIARRWDEFYFPWLPPAPAPKPPPIVVPATIPDGDDDMPKILINDTVLRGTFFYDGMPVSPVVLDALQKQGWMIVQQNHAHWREAAYTRMGAAAAAMYKARIL